MLLIPFLSERVFNSATFIYRHFVLTIIINFSKLHLKNCSGKNVLKKRYMHKLM